jgi:hypothetical protein
MFTLNNLSIILKPCKEKLILLHYLKGFCDVRKTTCFYIFFLKKKSIISHVINLVKVEYQIHDYTNTALKKKKKFNYLMRQLFLKIKS